MNSSERLATAFEKTAQFFFFIRWLGRVLNNINGQYGHYLPPFAWAQVILSISGGEAGARLGAGDYSGSDIIASLNKLISTHAIFK